MKSYFELLSKKVHGCDEFKPGKETRGNVHKIRSSRAKHVPTGYRFKVSKSLS